MSESARYETVIGLEVHAQLLTRTKIFCGCPTTFGAAPNTNVCPVCLGLPGALPVLNEGAVRLAVRAALALGCTLRERSRFARKNYFYPDSPKGYQISQFDEPYSEHGHIDLGVDGESDADDASAHAPAKRVRILRIHMEEDAGKSTHDRDDSLVDLNRSGVPLIEVVSEPDLRSAAEAVEYLRVLRDVLVFTGVNDGNLEEGSFRCDANVSIRRVGDEKLGTRVELKNINSFRFVEKAILTEQARQADILDGGGRIVQETRGWNEATGTTFSLRSKETAQDYRYFPEPDLPPLVLDEAYVARVRSEMPELPREKRDRFVRAFGLTRYAAGVLTQHPRIAAFFEEAATLYGGDPVKASNFIQSEVLRDVTTRGLSADIPVTARQVAQLLKLTGSGAISGKQAKDVYAKMRGTEASPDALVNELGMAQVSDAGVLDAVVTKVLEANAKQAEAGRGGKVSILGYLVGAVMKETKGSANPTLVNEILKKRLGVSA